MYNKLAEDIQDITAPKKCAEAEYLKSVPYAADADTIAVLCLDADHAKKAAEKLNQADIRLEVSLLKKDSMQFHKGISVMPFYLAKGLEFDAVFVPDLQNYVTPLHKQALYINATRALHILRLYECV